MDVDVNAAMGAELAVSWCAISREFCLHRSVLAVFRLQRHWGGRGEQRRWPHRRSASCKSYLYTWFALLSSLSSAPAFACRRRC
jgi:hypothetical protein